MCFANLRYGVDMKMLKVFEFGADSPSRWRWVQQSWGLFGLLLILATWRLWTPQTVYPRVPLIEVAGVLPSACQWAALSIALFALATVLIFHAQIRDRGRRWLSFAFVASMLVLIATDQHRLQPWAYQMTIYAVVLGSMRSDRAGRRRGLALLRILTISIYLYSSLGKFDFQFLHSVGQQFLEVTGSFVGIDIQGWPWTARLWAAALFPLIELLLVAALVVPRLRKLGVAVAVTMHASLCFILGPWGLGHEVGVLAWNGFFIAQAVLLFAGSEPPAEATGATAPTEPAPRHWLATGIVLAAGCLPLLEPLGWFDHWPAWGLYSPRNSRAIVEVHRAGIPSLPARLKPYLADAGAEASWVRLEIDAWSLEALAAPIYPQDRFQLGVAASIATQYGLERSIRVRLLGMSNRLNGVRQVKTLTGRQQLVAAAEGFRLNAHPVQEGHRRDE